MVHGTHSANYFTLFHPPLTPPVKGGELTIFPQLSLGFDLTQIKLFSVSSVPPW